MLTNDIVKKIKKEYEKKRENGTKDVNKKENEIDEARKIETDMFELIITKKIEDDENKKGTTKELLIKIKKKLGEVSTLKTHEKANT